MSENNVVTNKNQSELIVSDIFELAGEFSQETVAAFQTLDARVDSNEEEKELVRYELELVCDLCTNTEASLDDEQLQRIAEYLTDKLNSVKK
jgi:hypothetical protein